MEFTKEAWENAPEGATLEYQDRLMYSSIQVHFIGWTRREKPVIESDDGYTQTVNSGNLRIVLPKRKMTVQLWSNNTGYFWACVHPMHPTPNQSWTLHGEHTFEIEGE